MRLENKVVLITGAGTGIGRACAELFAKEGAKVIVSGIDYEPLIDVVNAIKTGGGNAIVVTLDVTSESAWDEAIAQAIEAYGTLDVLVNNAGIAIFGNAEDATLEQWEQTQAVNLTGVFLGTRIAIKAMKKHGGSIINVSSIEGIIADPNAAAYNASKGGVRIYSKSAALHCAQQGYYIRVNTLHPGFISTPMTTSNLVDSFGEEASKAYTQDLLTKIPLGRMAHPDEMATGMLFLACDDSSYMTGGELVMDGGFTAQ